MQKKNDEIWELTLFVIIVFNETREPNKYDPLSPKNIFAFGKLKIRKESKIIIWAVKKNENSSWLFFKLINNKTEFMIIKFIVNRPLNPSIKLAPLIINKMHNIIKIVEKNLFSIQEFKNNKSILKILKGKKDTDIIKKIIIKESLIFGLMFNLISSK